MISKTVLNNGIRVINQYIPHAHSVSIGIWVASGSRHESPSQNGIAHVIEHLLFKGTKTRSSLDIAREIDSVGGVLNAFTGREFVCYYTKVLEEYLPGAVGLLADIFLNSVFDEDEIDKERKVILQEIRMLEDNPDDFIHDLFHQNVWKGHPLGMPIIGTVETVEGLTRDHIVAYQRETYRAGDIIIASAGKITQERLLELLNGVFDAVPAGCGAGNGTPPPYEKRLERVQRELEQVLICLGTKALPQNHPKRFEALILNTILGGSMSSRLFQEVREKEGLAYSIYSYLASHSDAGTLVVSSGTSKDKVTQVLDILLREMRRIKHEPVGADELDAARALLKGNILLSLESNDNVMSKLAKNEIYFGAYQPLENIINGLQQVTVGSLMELCQEILDDRYLTLQLMGDLEGIPTDPAELTL